MQVARAFFSIFFLPSLLVIVLGAYDMGILFRQLEVWDGDWCVLVYTFYFRLLLM